ncbi:MAG: homocysteine S-methyltransferase family protein [Phycisphaerae bacterium]|nr:homocysteine S-methyltransferase family protein [Phycisphaerae bacterium]
MKLELDVLRENVMVADGGWSTQLVLRGLPADVMAETANLTHGDLVQDLARAYVEAGSQFITTNTFSANRFGLDRRGLRERLREVNMRGALLAQQAVGDRAVIAGSIGPSGKIMTVKEISGDELAEAVSEQASALAEGGADVIVLETFSEVAEILASLRAVKSVTKLPVVCSMSFDSGPQRTRTMMGAQAGECAAALEDAGADIIGCNCGAGIEHVLPVAVALRAGTSRPLWVKPNAGTPELEDGQAVWKQTPDEFVGHVATLLDAGVNIIGGCCGSGPEHIRKVAALVARRGGRKGV